MQGIRKRDAHCRTAKVSPMKELIHLSLTSIIIRFCSRAPFSRVSGESKPVKISRERKRIFNQLTLEWNFQKWLLNLSAQQTEFWLGKHDFIFWTLHSFPARCWSSRSLRIVGINMTLKPHICASKRKSVRNRSAVVRYREHCTISTSNTLAYRPTTTLRCIALSRDFKQGLQRTECRRP